MLNSEGRGHWFESSRVRHVFNNLNAYDDGRTENVRKTSSDEIIRSGTIFLPRRGRGGLDSLPRCADARQDRAEGWLHALFDALINVMLSAVCRPSPFERHPQ